MRRLIFGPESKFEHYLGCKVAACVVDGYRPHDEMVYVTYNTPGRQVARFALRDDRTMFFCSFPRRAQLRRRDTKAAVAQPLRRHRMRRSAHPGSARESDRTGTNHQYLDVAASHDATRSGKAGST